MSKLANKTHNSHNLISYEIQVKGLVQGVGFRPFIYRLASEHKLNGWVENRNNGVLITVQGNEDAIRNFLGELPEKAPEASVIAEITQNKIKLGDYKEFSIISSRNISDEITEISPDIAVCHLCIEDMHKQEHRIKYPFINCTNCGPRFTIIKDLPYDRAKTSMDVFPMCKTCNDEYHNIHDRRFHAQPVACNDCGPHYTLHHNERGITGIHEILKISGELLEKGGIIAIKGLGGYHIACNAFDESAISRLRYKKNREGKPFAVMFRSFNDLEKYAHTNETEKILLNSYSRPIVLLKVKKEMAGSVSNGLNTVGAMLPYMPFHHLLFEKLQIPAIILTSGNMSEEPIITENQTAIQRLTPVTDAIITYNRDISNRTDDSVVYVINNKVRISRRSRGYVPIPVNLTTDVNGIIAAGAELKNCFCVGKGKQAFLSQHIGDLKNLETYEFYLESMERFKRLFRISPELIACDLHPSYLSTKYAESTGLPIIKIQHHFAHIASCMAEHGLKEKIIGVSFDGTGYGDDGNTWGSEFFICNLESYKRISHFKYIPMPGGDQASLEPWRMAVSYLYDIFGERLFDLDLALLQRIGMEKISMVVKAIQRKLNSPLSSGAGRLFDAVASLTGLCDHNTFEAEAPIRLESIIDMHCKLKYHADISSDISFDEMIRELVSDIKEKVPLPVISAKFHNTIISVIFAVVEQMRNTYKINKVILSGGTFQNSYLLGNIENILLKNNFEVFTNEKVPANDGGIALGQLYIAAERRNSGCV